MITNEEDLTWSFLDSFEEVESVDICTTNYSDGHIILLSNDEFLIKDTPKLIECLQAAYNFHMAHKESM